MRPEPPLFAGDLAHCRDLLRHGSKSFAAASRLLPRRVREPATVLYAFCRVADDAIDGAPSPTAQADALGDLFARLDEVYAGRPRETPVDRALATVVTARQIPKPLLSALLEGMAWDAQGRRYESLEDLHAYAARVAGTVGAMMSVLMGVRAAHVVARACDLGVAMQLTNVARDVGEDAARGRLYLPRAWMREEGIDPDRWLAAPTHDPALARVVARLLGAAAGLYGRADAGVAELPADCRAAIRAARLVYSDIGRSIARAGFDSVSRRAFVPGARKAWLLLRALAARFVRGARLPAREAPPPLEATRFLVAAAESA